MTLNGPSIVTLSTSGMPTGVIGSIALAQEGLQEFDGRRRALLQERDTERVRAGLHRQSGLKALLELVAGRLSG